MNVNGLRDLLDSERGVFALALAIFSSLLVYTDRMTIQQWADFNQWLGVMLIGSKTITTGLEIAKRAPNPAPTPLPVSAPSSPIVVAVST